MHRNELNDYLQNSKTNGEDNFEFEILELCEAVN